MATVIERADAITHVTFMSAADQSPPIGPTDVAKMVDAAARPDPSGNPVEDLDDPDRVWLPTYDLSAAVAAVFEAKASEVANRFDAVIDRQDLSRSQLYDHFTKQARFWRSKTFGTLSR